jgi:hypothetical protein
MLLADGNRDLPIGTNREAQVTQDLFRVRREQVR